MDAMADNGPNLKKQWVSAEKLIMLGISLPAATFAGWAMGALLDRWLHIHWLPIAGLVLGTVAGFAQFIRGAMAAMKEQE